MRYMMLIYSTENADGTLPEASQQVYSRHVNLMEEATRKGVFRGAEPLAHINSATTVRRQDGKAVVLDGPFAETKEWLAGYYLIECENLDEAIEWAKKIPTSCQGAEGCIEIRPMRWQQSLPNHG
jgi:hypothetical protein